MPPSAVTAEAVAAAAVAADAAAAARDATAAAHDELDTVAEEPAAVTTAAEPATEPPVAALASVTLDAAPTDLAAPPEPPATTAPTPFAALATPPPPPPIDDDAPAIPRWAFLRVGRAMERSAVADADDEVSYLDVDLDPGAAPRARGFFAAAPPPPLADPAPPAPDGTPPGQGQGQGQGQLVVPGLPRGASAGSLAYSQTTTEGSYVDVHVSSPSSSSHGVSPRSQSSGRSEDI